MIVARRRAALTFALLFASLPASAQAPAAVTTDTQPLTHEALWTMKRVGAPAVSPDGRWVVVSVTEPSYDEKQEVSDLWIVPADGSAPPRRLTSTKGAESGVDWSPDSRRLAFTARREDDEVAQVYVLDVLGGGEARRLTASPLSTRTPRWSPDGRSLLYQGSAYPGALDAEANRKIAAERKEAKSKVRIYEEFPIRRWDRWLDDTQTHLFVVAADGDGTARDLLAGTRLTAQAGFGGPGGEGSSENLAPVWAPDGASVVFVAVLNRTAAAYAPVGTHLFTVPVAGGEPRQLTAGDTSYSSPRFAPDGRSLCFKQEEGGSRIYALDRVACASWPWSGSITPLTARFDRSVGDYAIAADGRIFLTAEDAGFVKLYSVRPGGGEVQPVLDSRGVFGAIEVARGARTPAVVASWGSATQPAEVVRVDPATGRQAALTRFTTEAAAALPWRPLQEFWFTNDKGRRIHSFIALPAGFDPTRKYPLFVLIHGGHANMWRDQISLRWNYHLLAEPGYVVLATDYRGSTGYGEAFTLDILGDPLRGPAEDINRAADEAIARFPYLDASRQVAGGASYGGHLANWLEATTTRYRALIGHAGLASLYAQWATSDVIHHRELMMGGAFWEDPRPWMDQSPIAHAKDFKTPMLLSVGENDFRVPMNNTLEMYAVLQRMRVPTRLLVWPDENHWILKPENSRVFYREVHEWLQRWLE
ncbi:MAG TPA: S9 family peptidase [Vicinamibacteria bacterium]|nr:S9 family peptidase [Vicinamibacteria bacterium]